MKVQAVVTLCAIASIGFAAQQAKADTYMTTTTSEGFPTTVTETRETTVAAPTYVSPAPVTVIRDQPVYMAPAQKEVVVVKKKGSHHLLNLGLVKVF